MNQGARFFRHINIIYYYYHFVSVFQINLGGSAMATKRFMKMSSAAVCHAWGDRTNCGTESKGSNIS